MRRYWPFLFVVACGGGSKGSGPGTAPSGGGTNQEAGADASAGTTGSGGSGVAGASGAGGSVGGTGGSVATGGVGGRTDAGDAHSTGGAGCLPALIDAGSTDASWPRIDASADASFDSAPTTVADAGDAGDAGDSGDGGPVLNACLPQYSGQCSSTGLEFIVDAHTAYADLPSCWEVTNPAYGALFAVSCVQPSCGSIGNYEENILRSSDTAVAALTGFPAVRCSSGRTTDCGVPITNAEILQARDSINARASSERVIAYSVVLPNSPRDPGLARMDAGCGAGIAAWQLFPAWSPGASGGYFLDDAVAQPFLAKVLASGVPRIAVHKGVPLPGLDVLHDTPRDIGPAAKTHPGLAILVEDAAICSGQTTCQVAEGPYDPTDPAPVGTNQLIRSLLDAGIAPGSNVYVELGLAYQLTMNDPSQATHLVGKLIKYVGVNNVLWGSGSIGTSTQAAIEAFRALSISQADQYQYGYAPVDDAIKAKIFGLNAARFFGLDAVTPRCSLP